MVSCIYIYIYIYIYPYINIYILIYNIVSIVKLYKINYYKIK